MQTRVLISGINGFIGHNLAIDLIDKGYKVYGISKSEIKINNAIIYKADVLDKDNILKICKDKDCIIHLATVTDYKSISEHPIRSLEVNLIGTYNLLQAFVQSKAKVFIFPSSGKVYGKPHHLPYKETHPTNPDTNLGKMKKLCEDLISYFAECTKKSYCILRIFNVYGPRQKKYFLIPTILSQLNNNCLFLGDINSKRDYIYIKDLVNAISTVMKHPKEGFEIFNVGSSSSYSAREIVKTIGKIKKKKLSIRTDKRKLRRNEHSEERADIAKLKSIGWTQKYNLEEGLREMLTNDKNI